MKKVVLIICSLILLASVGVVGMGCSDDDTVEWRLATYSLEGAFQTDMLYDFIDKVEENSDGKLKIELFTGGNPYALTEIFDAVSKGLVDLGFAGVTSYSSQQPKTSGILSYAIVTTSSVEQVVGLSEYLAKESPLIVEEAASKNISHLFYAPLSTLGNFYTFKVDELSDMSGKTLGCTGGVSYIVQAMGATAKPMEFLNFAADAQNGLVDGWVMAPIENYLQMGLDAVAPYVVNLNMITAMSCMINTDSFNDLDEDLQDAVEKAASETQTEWIAAIAANDQKVLQDIEDDSNVQFLFNLEGADRDTWFDTAITPIFLGGMSKVLSPDEVTDTLTLIENYMTS